jgi:hypothetical protein
MAGNHLIQKFLDTTKLTDKYSVEEIESAINSFFQYARKCVSSMTFPSIRLKGLGVFTPLPSKFNRRIGTLNKHIANETLTEGEFQELDAMYIHIQNNFKDFAHYEFDWSHYFKYKEENSSV